jgi:hypothetical protein
MKLTAIALASAFALSSTFALAKTVRHKPSFRTYDLHRWADQASCIRTTAIQTVQPACPRADWCGTEGARPSGAAARDPGNSAREPTRQNRPLEPRLDSSAEVRPVPLTAKAIRAAWYQDLQST